MANTSDFRNINFTALLYETLSGFLSINKAGTPTWFYKYCVACLVLLQQPFLDFVTFRNKEYLIANCKWQIGQLTNVLNYLYDSTLSRINISQAVATPEFLMEFTYPPEQFLGDFDSDPMEFWNSFGSGPATSIVTINVPAGVDLADLTATVAQIAIAGIKYTINVV